MTVPETSSSEIILPTEEDAQHQLSELTSQSWNLELLISGVAIFATLSLPDLLDSAQAYYRYNLMPDIDYMHDTLPRLIVGLIKGVSYVLFGAFLANFVMRAFWVGLVGLLTVYPTGIRYDQIHNLSRYAQQRYAREMGSLPNYIIRLDRRCNVIFALAFLMALFLLGTATLYGLFLGIMTLLQFVLPPETYTSVRETIVLVLVVGYLLFTGLMLVLNLPKLRENPKIAPISFRLTTAFSLLFLGTSRPGMFILYTFYSQIPKQVMHRRIVGLLVVLIVGAGIFTLIEMVQTKGASGLLDSRSFGSLRDGSPTADANSFDNLRPANDLITKGSIQADVIREPYIRLFIGYPKLLDTELAKRYKEPVWPKTLSKQARREQRTAWYLRTFSTYFGVYLNDSLYRSPVFFFTQRPDNGQRGLTTVLMIDKLKAGQNMLKVTVPDSSNKPAPYCLIPFWYVPEN